MLIIHKIVQGADMDLHKQASSTVYLYSECFLARVKATFPDRHISFEAESWMNAENQTAQWEYRPGIQDHGYGNRQCPWESELC